MTHVEEFAADDLGTPGACSCAVLATQINKVITSAVCVGVNADFDQAHRSSASAVHVHFDVEPSPADKTAAADVVAVHSNQVEVVPMVAMVTTTDGAAPDGGECWVGTSDGAVEITLPRAAASTKGVRLKRVGANGLVVKPHPDDQGNITIEGNQSHAVPDGATVLLRTDGAGWVNMGD